MGIWSRRPSCGLTWMMANPLLFWAWSAPGSFWAWRALVASFWPGVPWLIFGLECLGSFWRPGEPLVEFFRPGVPLVCFGLECLVSFWAWSAPGYAVANGELVLMDPVFGRLSPVSGSCHVIVAWSALHTAFLFLWVVFLTTKWHDAWWPLHIVACCMAWVCHVCDCCLVCTSHSIPCS